MTRFTLARSGIAPALALALTACTATIDATASKVAKKPAAATPKAVGATLQGVVRAPATLIGNDSAGLIGNDSAGLIGNDSAGLIGNDSAGLIGNDSGGYELLALAQQPCVRAKVTLADAAGTPLPGAPEVETDVMGRFAFPGKLPTGYGYHLLATVQTKAGKTAKLHAMAVPGDVTIDVPGTLVTLATLDGRKGAVGAMNNATFEKARAAADGALQAGDVKDLADEAGMKALAKDLMGRVGALETAVEKMGAELDKVKADLKALEASMATMAKEIERLTAPPAITIAQEYPTKAAPRAIRFDAAGTLWVACYKDASVQRVAADGKTTTIPVGDSPLGMDFGPDGDLWVSGYGSGTITRIAPDGTVKGSFPCGKEPFGVVTTPAGHVFVANYKAKTVTELGADGATIGTYPAPTRAFGLARDPAGAIWVTANADHGVVKLGGQPGAAGTGFATDRAPSMITFDAQGTGWVTATGSDRLTKLSATGEPLGSFDTGGDEPWGLAIAPSGDLWVTNTSGATKVDQNEAMRPQSVARFDAAGKRTGLWFLPDSPQGIAFDKQGRPWVALREANKVVRLEP